MSDHASADHDDKGLPPESPVYHSDVLTYTSYLKIPELLALQRQRATPAHHDELLFIVAHQVYELWFKQMIHELEEICRWLDADTPLRAAQRFERVHAIQHLLIEQIPLLETMFAVDFAEFRDQLRPASGFQSVQFRVIEFFCGNKNPKMLALAGDDDATRDILRAALERPTPYDHFLRFLAREDHDIFRVPADVLGRDTSLPHEVHEGVVAGLATLYKEAYRDTARYYAAFRVAEHLLAFDEKFAIWRFHHVKMVQRMIGGRSGTGGSSGARYLASTLERSFFPDLWAVRDVIGAGAYGSGGQPGPGHG